MLFFFYFYNYLIRLTLFV